jgi:hypothetical protein
MHYEVKGDRLRVNMDQGNGKSSSIIFDSPAKVMYILAPDSKMAIKSAIPQPAVNKEAAPPAKKVDFTRTGKTETIAGHECVVYTFADETSQGDVCNAEGMGTFRFAAGGRQDASRVPSAWEEEVRKKGLFPLRITTKSVKSGKITTIVATRIEKKSLPASEFEVPPDYRVMEGFGGLAGAFGKPATGSGAPGGAPAFNKADFMKKMMTATPEERQKMIEDMRKPQAGGAGSQQ